MSEDVFEIARKIKEDEEKEKEREAEREAEHSRSIKMGERSWKIFIGKLLRGFTLEKGFWVQKKWFAGRDYWVVTKVKKGTKTRKDAQKQDGDDVLSVVLSYERGTWDPSDDCRGVPYEEWTVTVQPGHWSGPTDSRGLSTTTEKTVVDEVAKIVAKHI